MKALRINRHQALRLNCNIIEMLNYLISKGLEKESSNEREKYLDKDARELKALINGHNNFNNLFIFF